MKVPTWIKLDALAKKYWKILSPEFEKAGTLTNATLPEFIKLCKNLSRRDQQDDFITDSNASLTEESVFIDATGTEHHTFKPSAAHTISKDLDRIISLQLRSFRPKPERKGKKKKDGDEFFD
ncbi:MAG: hypothetical protein ABFD81_06530 [Syntrophaceae bacterium]